MKKFKYIIALSCFICAMASQNSLFAGGVPLVQTELSNAFYSDTGEASVVEKLGFKKREFYSFETAADISRGIWMGSEIGWEIVKAIENGTLSSTSVVTFYRYDTSGLRHEASVDFDMINALNNSNQITDIEDPIRLGAVKGVGKMKELKEFSAQYLQDRTYSNSVVKGFDGAKSSEIPYIIQLANTESVESLKRTRFQKRFTNFVPDDVPYFMGAYRINLIDNYTGSQYVNVTSLLKSISLDNVDNLKEDYVAVKLGIYGHAIAAAVDIKKIKELKAQEIDIDKSDETIFYVYDSSLQSYDSWNLKNISKNIKYINQSQQNGGTCWFQSIASTLTMAEEPDLMQKILDGEFSEELELYSSYDYNSYRNEGHSIKYRLLAINIKQMLKLQQIADNSDIPVVHDKQSGETKPLADRVVNDQMKDRVKETYEKEYGVKEKDFVCALHGLNGKMPTKEYQKKLGIECLERAEDMVGDAIENKNGNVLTD